MARHKAAKHNIDVEWFTCPKCPKRFKQKANLTKHVTAKHGTKELLPCAVKGCKFKTNLEYRLNEHMKKAHGKK